MKVCTIVGARPQFIKAAPISRELRKYHEEILIHTGQHFDENMSDVFFEELEIPKPDYNLGISGGTHGKMTGEMLIKIEEVLIKESPEMLIVYGDTNSTLAGVLAAIKLEIPIAHIEAGPRVKSKYNPEENNRIIADHMSTLLFAPDTDAVKNLEREGIIGNVYNVGDVMYDTFIYAQKRTSSNNILKKYDLYENEFILMTLHRAENVDNNKRLEEIIEFISKIDKKIIFPIHPRTRKNLIDYGLLQKLKDMKHMTIIEPVGYLDMVSLLSTCSFVITDSGGLSKESFFGGAKCLFMLDAFIYPDLVDIGWIIKYDNEKNKEYLLELCNKAKREKTSNYPKFYGNGDTAYRIIKIINDYLIEKDK